MYPRHGNRSFLLSLTLLVCVTATLCLPSAGQTGKSDKTGSHSTRSLGGMTPGARALVEEATGTVCSEAKIDPHSSLAIDDMQSRPSLPVQAPEARAGAVRAQRLLPLAKNLVIDALKQLVIDYGVQNSRGLDMKVAQGIERVQAVRSVRPDVESRDNASVFLSRPHTI